MNPDIMLIPEIYPGIEEEATRVGADVYQMYDVIDVIAHEYEFGNGEHMAASRSQVDWFLYQAGMLTFRAFAQGKATWILNYSWDGEKGVTAPEPMKNLANSIVMTGANFWDAPGHSMAGRTMKPQENRFSRGSKKMKRPCICHGLLFIRWECISLRQPRHTAKNFSPLIRVIVVLIQQHREFQVVTPRTLANFKGETLVLPM